MWGSIEVVGFLGKEFDEELSATLGGNEGRKEERGSQAAASLVEMDQAVKLFVLQTCSVPQVIQA